MKETALFFDEFCFWHSGGNYAHMVPVGGMVQPLSAGGLPENPETKRRLINLIQVSGLAGELVLQGSSPATREDLERVHPVSYLDEFKRLSDAGGGELGLRTPFSHQGYEQASLSAGLVKTALSAVLQGQFRNAYALSRPPGHHCLPDWPNGFCLLANIAIAIEAARAAGLAQKYAVIDWDVHHGNGTQSIFYERADVLTISIHQENCYPPNSGAVSETGFGEGAACNLNIPLPPGAGHDTYLEVLTKIVVPKLAVFRPDVIIVASGYDASGVDPLSRMMCHAQTYGEMTSLLMESARELCGERLVMAHEGGYSEVHVPFCGHEVLSVMAGSTNRLTDPLHERIAGQQPNAEWRAHFSDLLSDYAESLLN